ncbi:MAG: tetratricopeptide (TPR) repeat protein [Patiriisocius sp.]|jgi:tetratricopeptide (TPR) repeat protein
MNKFLIVILLICSLKAEAQPVSALVAGDSLYAIGDYQRAIEKFEIAGEGLSVKYKLAKGYEAIGNDSKALTIYENIEKIYPDATIAKTAYGKLLYGTSRYPEAKNIFIELMMKNPINANTSYYLGLIGEKQNDTLSLKNFKQAYYLNPQYSDALYKIAIHYVSKQKFKNAKEWIEKGLQLNTKSTRFLILEGLSAYYRKEYHDAIAAFTKTVELGKRTEQVHSCLAVSYAKTYQYQKAVDEFLILISEYNAQNAGYHYNIGKCYMGLDEFEKGRGHVELSITIQDVSLHNEYMTLAASYNREKKFKETIQYLKLAIEEDPKSEKAIYELAVAADNYYKDDTLVLSYYQKYIDVFNIKGIYYDLALRRAIDLKAEIHFKGK